MDEFVDNKKLGERLIISAYMNAHHEFWESASNDCRIR